MLPKAEAQEAAAGTGWQWEFPSAIWGRSCCLRRSSMMKKNCSKNLMKNCWRNSMMMMMMMMMNCWRNLMKNCWKNLMMKNC